MSALDRTCGPSESAPMARSAARGRSKLKKGGPADTIRFLLLVFLVALVFRTFILAPFMIPSGSMLPRMMIGDYLFVSKWPYGVSRYSLPFGFGHFQGRWFASEPKRGDIVVFRFPGSDQDYVKRLIGLPGDRVQVRGGQLFLNQKPVPRVRIADWLMPRSQNSPCRYVDPDHGLPPVVEEGRTSCRYMRYRETLPGGRSYEVLDQLPDGAGDDTPVFTVPAGHYFMMGDNRDDSEDSRFPQSVGGVGFLPADNLIGRAEIVFFSTDGSASWVKPWTWFTATRWNRIGGTY
jgi:signal peptidase I